jgi:TetR/AcrR family transcriptional repressor of lmrAB and yxaGH operons
MISTAVTLFRRDGYAATSWRHLVEEAGTPWGSAYHHFPGGKEQLGVAAVTSAAELVTATIRRAFERTESAEEAITWWFGKAAQALAKGGYRDGCPVATVALETAHDSPALAEACQAAFTGWHKLLAGLLAEQGYSGTDELAVAIVNNLEGALVLSRVRRSEQPLELAARHLALLLRQPAAS